MSFLIGGEILDIDLTWEKGEEFLIKDGLIFPTSATLTMSDVLFKNTNTFSVEYSPFDTKSQRPVYEAFAKLGKKLIGNDKPENYILSFYKEYGRLDLYHFYRDKHLLYNFTTKYNHKIIYGERIIDIKNEAIRFYLLTQIYKTLKEIGLDGCLSDMDKTNKILSMVKDIDNLPDIYGIRTLWYDDLLQKLVKVDDEGSFYSFMNIIYGTLIGEFRYYLDTVQMHLNFPDRKGHNENNITTYIVKPRFSFSVSSLLSIIYLTYLNSINTNKIGYCEICGGVLYKSSKNKRVHTDCSNRMRQKRHNKKSLQG
ncbi:hypothetical protein [Thermoanaerobacterium thermosaccharolyticum]|uniref:hypothetical protein n=1 Tax=Thermoanaerobacterium thermosaccharolyticum TaxID=1517 RepID=UPI0020A4B506|nr:hypothetical protein [Thermoanaerobacterium thermosaccharolyticum]MCP2240197.1 hypothetical protein [Thermoanaerobacterium thermosaccharolyticum]